jgi:hypothetical protein
MWRSCSQSWLLWAYRPSLAVAFGVQESGPTMRLHLDRSPHPSQASRIRYTKRRTRKASENSPTVCKEIRCLRAEMHLPIRSYFLAEMEV